MSALLRLDAGPLSPAAAAAQQWQALVPALAARRKMRLSYDRGHSYPKRLERALSGDLPPCPAAVHIYDGESTQLLAADFDVKRAAGHGAVDAAGQVTADAAAFAELIRSCGGRGFGDISPNGGRHGYVLWAAPVPFGEMRRVALALARRFPSLDPSPMLGREHGIIRPPGSRHRTGGFQSLTTSLALAQRCAAQPNGPAVWARLCESLREQLDAIDRSQCPLPPHAAETAPKDAQWRLDEAGMPWLPRSARRLPRLRQDLELTAVTGGYDAARYPTPSHARFAVLGSAAARGWRLAEVTERMRSGAWDGLAGFFGRYKPKDRAAQLAADWKKAVAGAYGEDSGRLDHTREKYHAGGSSPSPADSDRSAGAYQQIRRWDCALRAGERQRWRGAHGITVRLVMRALAAASQMTGSTVIEFGTRSLGMLACLDHSTVARVLREVCAEDDPYLELLEGRRGVRGDLYMLRVPQAHADAAAWWRWRPGRLGVHPVFRVLGGAAALVCEQLTSGPVRSIDLPVLTGLSATAVSTALADLAAHAVAVRGPGGWRRGPASLDEVAGQLGVPEILAALQARYRMEREQWLAFLLLVPAIAPPVASPADDDVPWPEAPSDDGWHGEPAAARAPPTGDAFAAAVAVLEDQLGPVLDVTAA